MPSDESARCRRAPHLDGGTVKRGDGQEDAFFPEIDCTESLPADQEAHVPDTTDPSPGDPAATAPEHRLPRDMDCTEQDRESSFVSLLPTVFVIALGGALGAVVRYAALVIWPPAPAGFAWATYGVNAVGCAVMGILVVVFMELRQAHPLVRPFLATGFLGGFTTLSTYAADAERMARLGSAGLALVYFVGTPVSAVGAVALGSSLTRRLATSLRKGARG